MARSRARRTRSPHPGVVLVRQPLPSGGFRHRARFRDPLSGKFVWVGLDQLGLANDAGRRDWAIRKAGHLAKQRQAVKAGERIEAGPLSLPDAIRDYLENATAQGLKPVTVSGYGLSLARFQEWANHAGVRGLREVTQEGLAAFHQWLRKAKKRDPVRESTRGARSPSAKPRAPASTNHDLAQVRVFLHQQRRLGHLPPVLDRDRITEALRPVRDRVSRPAFLRIPELRRLLEAAIRHDATRFELTRTEKAGEAAPGGTPRHAPVAPFLLAALLSGMRAGELFALRWEWVYLDGQRPEFVLPAESTKTGHERSIPLDITPHLAHLLAALKLRAGGDAYVFGGPAPLSRDVAEKARGRLVRVYGAPAFSWQRLRQTCATFLTNAPGIYGGAAAWHSARRTGHSVLVAEKRYVGLVADIPPAARTLEAAMGIEDLAAAIVRGAAEGPGLNRALTVVC